MAFDFLAWIKMFDVEIIFFYWYFRLSTIIGADQILVIHNGEIAERGR